MKRDSILIGFSALLIAFGISAVPADAGQRDSHGRDRNGRESRGQVQRSGGGGAQQEAAPQRQSAGPQRESTGPQRESAAPAPSQRQGRGNEVSPSYNGQGRSYAVPRPAAPAGPPPGRGGDGRYSAPSYSQRGYSDHGGYYGGRPQYGYRPQPYHYDRRSYGPYGYVVVPAPRYYPHYYGPGGHLSVYFGWGNGYLYGSPWNGRVYGYIAPGSYGTPAYYGDIRLLVQPRDAEVYVDGYYAGIVDDFDGAFQRLTLQVGPHQIELAAPGLEPRYFDVYVDPARTVDIHADLFNQAQMYNR